MFAPYPARKIIFGAHTLHSSFIFAVGHAVQHLFFAEDTNRFLLPSSSLGAHIAEALLLA
ncbi:MAG: hypothetical protein D3916_15750 [Candidatus Electrothrix sp. MAN1_4]|nr:hypothetical protein [Candidatus Electrothrix sp. MAN1_4]